MITEHQQELASLYALGALEGSEQSAFEAELGRTSELRDLVRDLQRVAGLMVKAGPQVKLPTDLKSKVLGRIDSSVPKPKAASLHLSGLRFLEAASESGWKELPLKGAFVKLLSIEKERGYAVLLGKINAGVPYPAHKNAGPEDFYILSGDLIVGDRKLVAGDYHHADAGSDHAVNYSETGCTLIAVLTTSDPLVAFAAS